VVLLITAVTPKAPRSLARRVLALVDLGVGVTELDGDVALEFVLETDGMDSRDGFDGLRFTVLLWESSEYGKVGRVGKRRRKGERTAT
jgi:hypothetical protein